MLKCQAVAEKTAKKL